jgi:hypothetical protein
MVSDTTRRTATHVGTRHNACGDGGSDDDEGEFAGGSEQECGFKGRVARDTKGPGQDIDEWRP